MYKLDFALTYNDNQDNPKLLMAVPGVAVPPKLCYHSWRGHVQSLVSRKMCVCVYSHLCISTWCFNVSRLFFVQALKIGVNSWKFSMLLLYILWDNWPISMISASNEKLQQQLEYTILEPDCHNWWISKMQFGLGKNATETYGILQTAFQPSGMNGVSVFEWHKRFKEGRESVRDDERCERSKEVNTPELIGQRVRVRVTMLKF